MPQGGEYAIGLGAAADEDPAVQFRNGMLAKYRDTPLTRTRGGVNAMEQAAVDEFRVWQERHNSELQRRDDLIAEFRKRDEIATATIQRQQAEIQKLLRDIAGAEHTIRHELELARSGEGYEEAMVARGIVNQIRYGRAALSGEDEK